VLILLQLNLRKANRKQQQQQQHEWEVQQSGVEVESTGSPSANKQVDIPALKNEHFARTCFENLHTQKK